MTDRGEGVRLTAAQLLALMWLPADGSWRTMQGKAVKGLNSLRFYHPEMVDGEWGDFGPRGGRKLRGRLTDAGVAEQARRGWAVA
jgi:hypothetical protein